MRVRPAQVTEATVNKNVDNLAADLFLGTKYKVGLSSRFMLLDG
jgi:hypothetical protein